MKQNTWIFRFLFFISATLIGSLYYYQNSESFLSSSGILMGCGIFALAFALELLIRKVSLKVFNIFLFGLLYGGLIAFVLLSFFNAICQATNNTIGQNVIHNVQIISLLISCYLGIWVASCASQQWQKLIPFLRAPQEKEKSPVYIDISALDDSRLLELAKTGLVNNKLVVGDAVIQEIQKNSEISDENIRLKAKRCQENIKRLESIGRLGIEVKSGTSSTNEEYAQKIQREIKEQNAYLLVSESMPMRDEQDQSIICLDALASILKPQAQRGEALFIKIQRLGKEPNQGIGYLKDGTMVVVNGGGEYLNNTIQTQVLSQKYSSSGKIIFCNAAIQDENSIIRHDATAPINESNLLNQLSMR